MNELLSLNPNPLVQYLQKPTKEFTKSDIIRYIIDHKIEMVNFRYAGGDGRLKTLNFIINDLNYLDTILSAGERVDGSSLFPFIEASSSDLYVVPRFRTAFINPFSAIPALDILCSYYTKDGDPLESSPDYTLRKAYESLKTVTGMELETMGELEYYVIAENNSLYQATDQRGYHESSPFCKFSAFRCEAMRMIAQSGGLLKYGHSEVGNFSLNNMIYEQNEIEFLPTKLEDAADKLMIAKWIMRTLAQQHNLVITFAPKITAGKAGSGMHVHTRLQKDGKNMFIANGVLTEAAHNAIAGYLSLAPSLTAFGNTNPTSYLRLVPHQEAPTNICWGDRNRSALVRVPLGWTIKEKNMLRNANPLEKVKETDYSFKQTIEFRCPDGSADIYLLMAGLAVAARHGFEMQNAIQYAKDRYISVNIFEEQNKKIQNELDHLPISCFESAEKLQQQRAIYEKYDIFSPGLIDGIINKLKKFNDKNLREQIKANPDTIMDLVHAFFHCG